MLRYAISFLFFFLSLFPVEPIKIAYDIVDKIPHRGRNFTQGLLFHNGNLYESTGLFGKSTLKEIDLKTGKITKQHFVVGDFAEGLAFHNNKLYQLTWKKGRAYVYSITDFKQLDVISYKGEGWGLTTSPEGFVMSDGSSRLWFRDFTDFRLKKKLLIKYLGQSVVNINELEYVKGYIFANVWHLNRILVININSGVVDYYLDLSSLTLSNISKDSEAVLNGIAYDSKMNFFYITGKKWPYIYQIKLKNWK